MINFDMRVVLSLSLCFGIFMGYKYSPLIRNKLTTKLLLYRSNYIWKLRKKTPHVVTYWADKFFSIDKKAVKLNISEIPSERIYIHDAIEVCQKGNFIVSRLSEMESIIKLMDFQNSGSFTLTKNETFKLFGCLDYPWFLKITYVGHSNIEKRIEAKKFTVLYKFGESSEFHFPPYNAHDSISTGFSAPKIKSAKLESGKYMFCLDEVKEYSGLKYDFYNSCPHKEVVKNYFDHPDNVIVNIKNKTLHVNNNF